MNSKSPCVFFIRITVMFPHLLSDRPTRTTKKPTKKCPLVMTNIAMDRSTITNGKTDFFDWAIFNSYVKLPEGTSLRNIEVCFNPCLSFVMCLFGYETSSHFVVFGDYMFDYVFC